VTNAASSQVSRHDVPAPRYTSYPTVPCWRSLDPQAHAGVLVEAGTLAPEASLSLYVHLPFCRRLCTFCGCNVVVSRDPTAVDRYLDHLAREVAMVAGLLGARRSVAQLHWGGGTPTFLAPAQPTASHSAFRICLGAGPAAPQPAAPGGDEQQANANASTSSATSHTSWALKLPPSRKNRRSSRTSVPGRRTPGLGAAGTQDPRSRRRGFVASHAGSEPRRDRQHQRRNAPEERRSWKLRQMT
jgi:hypothetical protein